MMVNLPSTSVVEPTIAPTTRTLAPMIGSPVHQILLAVNGIHILESLKLDVLAAQRVNEFAFVIQPLKLKGATGASVAPTAIR